MRRLGWLAILPLVLAAASVVTTAADTDYPIWAVARFGHLPGGGTATSVITLCANSLDQCGPPPNVTTVVKGAKPGQTWTVELYDHGHCNNILHVLAVLPPVRIGSDGRRTGRVLLPRAQLLAISYAARRALRLSTAGQHTCLGYGEWKGG